MASDQLPNLGGHGDGGLFDDAALDADKAAIFRTAAGLLDRSLNGIVEVTLIEFTAAVAAYERIHGRGSARAKHRAFARFRREVEAAEAERRRARLAAGARAFSEGGLP